MPGKLQANVENLHAGNLEKNRNNTNVTII